MASISRGAQPPPRNCKRKEANPDVDAEPSTGSVQCSHCQRSGFDNSRALRLHFTVWCQSEQALQQRANRARAEKIRHLYDACMSEVSHDQTDGTGTGTDDRDRSDSHDFGEFGSELYEYDPDHEHNPDSTEPHSPIESDMNIAPDAATSTAAALDVDPDRIREMMDEMKMEDEPIASHCVSESDTHSQSESQSESQQEPRSTNRTVHVAGSA